MRTNQAIRDRAYELAAEGLPDQYDHTMRLLLKDFHDARQVLIDLLDATGSHTSLADERKRMPEILDAAKRLVNETI